MAHDIRYFRMKNAQGEPGNKIMFGEVLEESEKTLKIRGMYLAFVSQRIDQTEEDVVPSTGGTRLEPFSPVGDQVQVITIPTSRIAEEYHDMPAVFAHSLSTIYASEQMNNMRREKLLSMKVPNRPAASAEEAFAPLAKYIAQFGKLPETFGNSEVSMFMPQGIEAGNYKTVETSPYREAAQ